MFDLSDRVAIVTGGAQGVGGGISRILARAGAKVLIADIDIDMARNTEELICKNSGIAESLKIDVTSYEDLKNKIISGFDKVNYKNSIEEALKSLKLQGEDIILITGSLYLAGEVLNLN